MAKILNFYIRCPSIYIYYSLLLTTLSAKPSYISDWLSSHLKSNMIAVKAAIDFVDITGWLSTTWDATAREDDTANRERRQMQQQKYIV